MNILRPFKIIGAGSCQPKRLVTNDQLETQLSLPKGWIEKYTGVKTRYRVEEETVSTLGAEALKSALADASIQLRDLDYLIGGGASFDYVLPNRSSSIVHLFDEAKDCDFPCVDINSTCVSFISALNYASLLLQDPEINTLAIVISEVASKGLNEDNPETYSLFGDSAAAVILTKDPTGKSGLIRQNMKTYTESNHDTIIKGGGIKYYPGEFAYDKELYSFNMNGKRLLRFTRKILPSFFQHFFEPLGIYLKDIELIIPHQASKLGLKLFDEHTKEYGGENVVTDHLEKYGNCIAASIPVALVESIQNNRLKRGETCLLAGTAAGISIAGALIKY